MVDETSRDDGVGIVLDFNASDAISVDIILFQYSLEQERYNEQGISLSPNPSSLSHFLTCPSWNTKKPTSFPWCTLFFLNTGDA